MRENYFVNFIKYINNVYHIDKKIEHITDKRINPTYKTMFCIDGIEQPLRYIKFAKKSRKGDRTQILIVTTSMTIGIKTIYMIIKARWDTENRKHLLQQIFGEN